MAVNRVRRCCRALVLGLTVTGCTRETAPPPERPRTAEREEIPSTPRVPCLVTAVTDGDSFKCRDIDRVRLLLLDAPEMDQTPFGARSRDALRARMPRGDSVARV